MFSDSTIGQTIASKFTAARGILSREKKKKNLDPDLLRAEVYAASRAAKQAVEDSALQKAQRDAQDIIRKIERGQYEAWDNEIRVNIRHAPNVDHVNTILADCGLCILNSDWKFGAFTSYYTITLIFTR